jgi:hypothetical protein
MDLKHTSSSNEILALSQREDAITADPNFGYPERVLEKLGFYTNKPMYSHTTWYYNEHNWHGILQVRDLLGGILFYVFLCVSQILWWRHVP